MTNQPPMATGTQSQVPPSRSRAMRLRDLALPVAGVFVLAVIFLWVWLRLHSARLIAPEAATVGVEPTTSAAPGVAVSSLVESQRWYYVSGELQWPSRRLYEGRITLLQAIAAAGGGSGFADRERVRLTHIDGRVQIINCIKPPVNPSLNLEVGPGDTIFVYRQLGFHTDTAPPSYGTNEESAQRAEEVFRQRYGLTPQAAPPNPSINRASPEDMFARRYGLAPSPAVAPTGNPDLTAAFAARYGLGGGAPSSASSGTNANSTVAASGPPPSSYQWRFGTNGTTAPTTGGLLVTKLTPLCLKLTLESVTPMDTGTRYVIGLENEAAASPGERSKRQYYCSLNNSGKQEIFTLREAKAPPDDPTNATVVLELKDSGERVAVSKDHPFQRVDGYAADLRYEPEHKTWIDRRVGNVLAFGGNEAQIIAITRTEVVMGAKSSVKTWAIELKGPPADQSSTPGPKATPKQP